ncbi:MAG: hypothetical protein M1827_007398 [Pycnora praestabilis]|nr:MAG: hypothetical protein M1827_007398 [Pycnora praestabilis]
MNRLGPINQKYLGGLESLRIKTFASYREPKLYKPQRMYSNTLSRSGNGLHVRYGLDIARLIVNNLQEEKRLEKVWDEAIFSKFPEICEVLGDYLPKSSQSLGNIDITILDDLEVPDPRVVGLVSTLLEASSSTLKYIDLDWIFGPHGCIPLYHQLNSIRFNNLRALQVRNSALLEAGPELFLLHEGLFGFLGRHSGIQCLGWPIDRFFAPSAESNIVQDPDFCNVVSTLGRTLKELRLGTTFGKSLDGAGTESIGKEAWESRRLFIEHFATYMLVLNVLKFRGTVPTLETQNLIHALKRCPIQKLVLEGSFDNLPWGLASHKHFQDGITNGPPDNEERRTWKFPILDKELKQHDGLSEIWKLVARFWSATITDIKIRRIDDTDSFVTKYPNWGRDFRPLQSLHQLRYFAIPILLDTTFESKVRNKEVVAYWHDAQRPTSTALAIPAGVEIENVWAKALRQWYSPDKLAAHVASLIGRYLSPQAKARYGGVTICALLTLKPSPGSSSHVVYELRVGVGEMNQPLWFDGPVTRGERRKSRDKFKARQWF